ncbi:MAG TPA: hypothetical protein VFP36_00075, partial [Usitatibacter sp.]|nr:hypothetical protein [Usitatibacter sp.]
MKTAAGIGVTTLVVAAVVLFGWYALHLEPPQDTHIRPLPPAKPIRQAEAADPMTRLINRGEYLARAGDCVACHTEPTGRPFAGG